MEILMMIVFAFIIGFAGAWLVSENIFLSIRHQVGKLLADKRSLTEQLHLKDADIQSAKMHLAQWKEEAAMLARLKNAAEPLLVQAQTQVSSLQQEVETYHKRYENLKQETDSIREVTSQLKNELNEQKQKAEKLQLVVEQNALKKETERRVTELKDIANSRFTPSSRQAKNDLTLIRGIGPVIQRKLNELGIYTFQQISEFTPEMVERVTKSIKFFPDRIGRDNWIGQAAALARHRS